MDAYYKGSLFLPRLNNEIASNRNETYKKRLESLNHLVLIMVSLFFTYYCMPLHWSGRVMRMCIPQLCICSSEYIELFERISICADL